MTKASDSPSKMTAREHAAMTLKVPMSGTEWLDQMVIEARRLDAEAFQSKVEETTRYTASEPVEANSAGQPKRARHPTKEPELRDQKD